MIIPLLVCVADTESFFKVKLSSNTLRINYLDPESSPAV